MFAAITSIDRWTNTISFDSSTDWLSEWKKLRFRIIVVLSGTDALWYRGCSKFEIKYSSDSRWSHLYDDASLGLDRFCNARLAVLNISELMHTIINLLNFQKRQLQVRIVQNVIIPFPTARRWYNCAVFTLFALFFSITILIVDWGRWVRKCATKLMASN